MGSTLAQLREGIAFIRANRSISWSLVYLGIAASLVGVLGVAGPEVRGRLASGSRTRTSSWSSCRWGSAS